MLCHMARQLYSLPLAHSPVKIGGMIVEGT